MTPTVTQSGTIETLIRARGFGFVLADDGLSYFFHATDLTDDGQPFTALREGQPVQFEADTPNSKGLRVCWVRGGNV